MPASENTSCWIFPVWMLLADENYLIKGTSDYVQEWKEVIEIFHAIFIFHILLTHFAHSNAIQCLQSEVRYKMHYKSSPLILALCHHISMHETQLDLFLHHSMSYWKDELLCVIWYIHICWIYFSRYAEHAPMPYLGADVPVSYISLLHLGCRSHQHLLYPTVHCYKTLLFLPLC